MSKMRVWHIPQIGYEATYYVPVKTVEEGRKVLDILAAYDLFQLENHIKPDFASTNGIQVFNEEAQEWEDWYLETEEDYFDDVDDYLEDNKEIQNFSVELFSQLKGNRKLKLMKKF